MGTLKRTILLAVAALLVLLLIAVVAVPAFLNADSFRTRIETALTHSLGRQVTIGKLDVSLLSGGLVASNAAVADDPHFSTQPFLQAASIKIGVKLIPLIFSHQVQVSSFTLQSPQIQVIRAPNGTWNYSSVGNSSQPAAPAATPSESTAALTVASIEVADGRLVVSTLGSADASRTYDQLALDVKDFDFAKPFSFTASAHLPGDGTVDMKGKAGPIDQQDASLTPFSGQLELKHIDPLAAGFVTAADGITGSLGSLVLDAAWSGQALHIAKLVIDAPKLAIVRSNAPKAPPAQANPEGTQMLHTLSVDSAEITNGALTLTTAGQSGPPAVYQQLNATLSHLAPNTASPFTLNAQLPGGGTLAASGNEGPINFNNYAFTPANGQATLKHVQLETSGVLAPDAGIKGLTDLQANFQSNGQSLTANGTAHIEGIQLAKNGQPSAKPVDANFNITQNEQALTGSIQSATISVGKAVFNLGGSYQSSGASTAINLKVDGRGVPIDELEAFLPAAGVRLPTGSRLEGGTLTADLTVSGSTAAPIINGPVRLDGTRLAGFDLGSKLSALSSVTGGKIGSSTGNGTPIRTLSMNVNDAGGTIRTDKIVLDVTGVGTATGAGSVADGGALNYDMVLKLTGLTGQPAKASATPVSGGGGIAGLAGGLSSLIPGGGSSGGGIAGLIPSGLLKSGIPVKIGGTTSNPTFAPNLAGLVGAAGLGAVQSLTGTRSTKAAPAKPNTDQLQKTLGGLFGR